MVSSFNLQALFLINAVWLPTLALHSLVQCLKCGYISPAWDSVPFVPFFTYSVSFHFLPALIFGGFLPHINVLLITPRGPQIEGAQRENWKQWQSRGKYDGGITAGTWLKRKRRRLVLIEHTFFPKEQWNQKYFCRCLQTCTKVRTFPRTFPASPFVKSPKHIRVSLFLL